MNFKAANKVSGILIPLVHVLKNADLEETSGDLNVAKVIFVNNCE